MRYLNLYLQFPDEVHVEVLKDFAAIFYDVSRQDHLQEELELRF